MELIETTISDDVSVTDAYSAVLAVAASQRDAMVSKFGSLIHRISWDSVRCGDVLQFTDADGKPYRMIATEHSRSTAPFGCGRAISCRPVPADYVGEGFVWRNGNESFGPHTFPYASYLDMDFSEVEYPVGYFNGNRRNSGRRVCLVWRTNHA